MIADLEEMKEKVNKMEQQFAKLQSRIGQSKLRMCIELLSYVIKMLNF